jgi:DNA-binding CsgD family transcriptional regulator
MLEPHPTRDLSRVFVGRQRELAELKAALDRALSGQGQLVMLVGEPGIGKTRTAQELAALAEERGAQVLWGRCYEEQGAPPYWPWVQPIRAYVQQASAEQLAAEMGPGAADIAEIVPELREKLPDLETPPGLDPEPARFRLFDSITTFLKNASQSQPMMLVLDDLHWADKPSLLLLQFLARQLAGSPLLVLGCYRDVELSRQHSLSDTLAQLAREPVFHRQALSGLNPEDTGKYVTAAAGFQPPQELMATIYDRTEGNPFFVTEVIRLLLETGELTSGVVDGPGNIRIPEGVREVIGQRLNRLSEHCSTVLTTASIIGREFDFRLLNVLSGGMSEDQLLQAVDEAVSFHLIEEAPGQIDRYQFSHALIQQTLAEEVTTSRRVRLHARIAEALETLYADDADTHAAELANHFAEAEPVLGTGRLVYYSILAGERAQVAYAYEEAQSHFERALAAKEGQAMDGEMAALLFGLGRAQVSIFPLHQTHEAVATLRQAFDYYAETGDVDRAVAVAKYPVVTVPGHNIGMAPLLARALDLAPPDSRDTGRLLSQYGSVLGAEKSDYEGAQDAFGRALDAAHREQDPSLELQTQAYAGIVDIFHLHYQEGVGKLVQAIDLAQRTDDPRTELLAHFWAMYGLVFMGSGPEAQQAHASALQPLAEKLRDHFWLVQSSLAGSTRASNVAPSSTTRNLTNEALASAPTDIRTLGMRAMHEYQAGNFDQGQVYLEQHQEAHRLMAPSPTIAYLSGVVGVPLVDHETGTRDGMDYAQEVIGAVVQLPYITPLVALNLKTGVALIAVVRGDVESAREQYTHLEPMRGTMLPPGGIVAADRVLGLLSVTMGRLDQAVAHFEEALASSRRAGRRDHLPGTYYDYADALLNRNGQGDRERAISLLEESLVLSAEIGMRPLMERAADLKEQAELQTAAIPLFPDGLTQREVEVLRLIAGGKTNLEIAEELVIAEGTARRHVANIYEKIGATNRVEAAAYAAQHGLSQ